MKQKGMKQQSGFTLIELMIVVAILGIISTIAYGSYQDSVRKTKRAEAKTALMDLGQKMERCYTANGNYDTACTAHNGATLIDTLSEHGHYDLAIPTLDATTFTVTATANFADPRCDIFSVTHTGAKTSVDDAGNDSTAACW